MPTKYEQLPEGWSKLRGHRPTYRRADGYVVKFDGTAKWGIRAPGATQPFDSRPDMQTAMAYVDENWPRVPSP